MKNLICFLLLLSSSQLDSSEKFNGVYSVSIIELIAKGERFHGKMIFTMGYLSIQDKNAALYFSKSDAKLGITKNSIWLDMTNEKDLNNSYVEIEGLFNNDSKKENDIFSGSVSQITSVTKKYLGPIIEEE